MSKKVRISKQVIKDYENLISEVSEIHGIIYHSNSIINGYLNSFKKPILKKLNVNLILGSHFTYRSPYDGKLIFGDSYFWDLKNFNRKIDVIKRKINNYHVAAAYEAFEKFLRSITSRIIINNQKTAQGADETLGFSSYKSCMLFLRSQYRDNLKIIALLRKLSPELNSSFNTHRRLRNFLNFYRVYSKCRNHIIHSTDLVDSNSFNKPEVIDEKFAIRYFGIQKNKKGNKYLIDTTSTYKEVLETLVGFAYLLITSFDSRFIN